MANQILEFNATSGLSLTARLFALESDTIVASVAAVERTNDKGRYRATFVNVPAGNYRLNAFVGSVGGFANEIYTLTLTDDVFLPLSETRANFTVVPATANGPKRVTANTIPLYVGERLSTPVPVFDADGDPIVLTGRTLLLKIETQQRNAVMSVTPTISGSTFTFTPSAEVTQSARVLIWALWDVTAQAIIATGEMPVSYAPQR